MSDAPKLGMRLFLLVQL